MDISHYRPDAALAPRSATKPAVQTYTAPTPQQMAQMGLDKPVQDATSLFDMVLDTVNPLQHIPGVSSAYQQATGDESSPIANMAGGFLFGGPVGLAAGAATSFLEFLTGKDLMGHAMALFGMDGDGSKGPGQVEHIQTAAVQAKDSLFQEQSALGLEHYQAFATAQAQNNAGIGAAQQDVSWSSNIWMSQALKDASSLYQSNQELNKTPSAHTQARTYDMA